MHDTYQTKICSVIYNFSLPEDKHSLVCDSHLLWMLYRHQMNGIKKGNLIIQFTETKIKIIYVPFCIDKE